MTATDFLKWDREQLERHVFMRGEVFAMSGGSLRHSFLGSRAVALLDAALRGGRCTAHGSDARIGVDDEHLVYADAVVLCQPLQFRPGATDVVTNPTVVVEVLSHTTEAYVRSAKQAGYLALPSVRHFVLVSQRERRMESYTRTDDGTFLYRVHGPGDELQLPAINTSLRVDDVYDGAFELPGDA